jgi:hypothetical protein
MLLHENTPLTTSIIQKHETPIAAMYFSAGSWHLATHSGSERFTGDWLSIIKTSNVQGSKMHRKVYDIKYRGRFVPVEILLLLPVLNV